MAKFRKSASPALPPIAFYVQRAIYEPFLKLFVEKVRGLHVGDGLDPRSQIGALIDEEDPVQSRQHVEDAVRGGARLCAAASAWPEPVISSRLRAGRRAPRGPVHAGRTFGPVPSVCVFDTEASD